MVYILLYLASFNNITFVKFIHAIVYSSGLFFFVAIQDSIYEYSNLFIHSINGHLGLFPLWEIIVL